MHPQLLGDGKGLRIAQPHHSIGPAFGEKGAIGRDRDGVDDAAIESGLQTLARIGIKQQQPVFRSWETARALGGQECDDARRSPDPFRLTNGKRFVPGNGGAVAGPGIDHIKSTGRAYEEAFTRGIEVHEEQTSGGREMPQLLDAVHVTSQQLDVRASLAGRCDRSHRTVDAGGDDTGIFIC